MIPAPVRQIGTVDEHLTLSNMQVAKALFNMKQQMRFLDGETIDLVLIGGGGGTCYSAAAREIFPLSKIIAAKEPVVSNAYGYWLNHQ